ncbi:hypothetical protein KKF91_06215 [Myxococcota bacterium]|nr:hypothetical protein [Myxococcota bacterium]MBU1430147.1 hypothetical protein [Myxococcota bacterium]MBU1900658.1 hypothetical protein [Myxococcota bacterium]
MKRASLILSAALMGCGIMQSMMTASVDETAGAEVLALKGALSLKRLGPDGNSFSTPIQAKARLKTADLVLGSEDEASQLWLKLAEGQAARFDGADFVLRAPFGEDSSAFMATIELGRVVLDLKGSPEQRLTLIDTNKNQMTAAAPALIYLVVDDEQMAVFVKEGAARLENTREAKTVEITAGQGHRINAEGGAEPQPLPTDVDWSVVTP